MRPYRIKSYLKDYGQYKSIIGSNLLKLYAWYRLRPAEITPDLPTKNSSEKEESLLGSDRYATNDYWTYDEATYKKWGELGVHLAKTHLEQLYQFCQQHSIRLTIAVHPWPVQIEQKDLDCKQVQIWQSFAAERKIEFINFFPDFINEAEPLEFFIEGDVHWNEKGHRKVAQKIIDGDYLSDKHRYSQQY